MNKQQNKPIIRCLLSALVAGALGYGVCHQINKMQLEKAYGKVWNDGFMAATESFAIKRGADFECEYERLQSRWNRLQQQRKLEDAEQLRVKELMK